jgi:hypothetical protein
MAWVIGGNHFGEYTYQHWFDDENENSDPMIDDNKDTAQSHEKIMGNGSDVKDTETGDAEKAT